MRQYLTAIPEGVRTTTLKGFADIVVNYLKIVLCILPDFIIFYTISEYNIWIE